MPLFQFQELELLTFFMVLLRMSVLFSIFPMLGDRQVPAPAKILLALATTAACWPGLIKSGAVRSADALIWGKTSFTIAGTAALEVLSGLVLGFTSKVAFEVIEFGANLVGTLMGFAAANLYDPQQEAQTQVVAQIQVSIAFLIFLVSNGHHFLIQAAAESYSILGLGAAQFGPALRDGLVSVTSGVFKLGIAIAAPVAVSLFVVHSAFGIISKALPQMNVLVLSFSATALVGIFVMFVSISEFVDWSGDLFAKTPEWFNSVLIALKRGG